MRTASAPAEWLRWVRLRDRAGLDPMVELMAIADCLPPAAFKLLGEPAPISSLTWQLNLLGPAAPRPTTAGGCSARTPIMPRRQLEPVDAHLERAGRPVAEQVQGVAMFG